MNNLYLWVNFIPYFPMPKVVIRFYCLNFELEDIKVNESALDEMVRTRNKSLFYWQHPLIELNGISMCIFNIRSLNVHLEHFLSDKIYST